MGCRCDSKFEELEIEKSPNIENPNSNPNFQTISEINKISSNNSLLHKSSTLTPDIKDYLSKHNEIFQTISDKNVTINYDENTSKKNTIDYYQPEEGDDSIEENIIDKSVPSDEFSKYIFTQINLLRENPSSFISLIQGSESNIQRDKKNRLIYKTKLKVALDKGIKAFEEAKLILSNTKSMQKLKFDYDMKLKLPKNEINIKSNNYLKKQVLTKGDKGINIKAYWKEVIYDPETCFVLMVVDDNGKKAGFKRRNILNPEYKYIGINSKFVGKTFIAYFTFSK
jgi:hypothetical protein